MFDPKAFHPRKVNEDFRKIIKRHWIDKITFKRIFVLWILIIVFFGLLYAFFATQNSFLSYTSDKALVANPLDAIYFSFVAATTTGFGDIVPSGLFKLISIIEVIIGLILIALVTSRLVSIKQDVILNEVYEISFHERINRLRSSLLLFRQNLGSIISDAEEGTLNRKKLPEIEMYLSSFSFTLKEILSMFTRKNKNEMLKRLDPLNTEIIFNSILASWEKLIDLANALEDKKTNWRTDAVVGIAEECLLLTNHLLEEIKKSKILSTQITKDITTREQNLAQTIKETLSKKEKGKTTKLSSFG